MQPWLRYELLFFYTRDELEHLQPLSKSLLNAIIRGSRVLSLRPIFGVNMNRYGADDKIQIFVDNDHTDEDNEPDYEASIIDGDFKETFLRLQHTCIMDICVEIRDSPFLRYWKAQETAAFTVVNIDCYPPEEEDYDVLDSIVNHLRPRTTEVNVEESSWEENDHYGDVLLAHASYLNNLQTCNVIVWENAFPPPAFFLKGPGYPVYQVLSCVGPVADGIDCFIESFVRDGCTNKKLESVCINWSGPQSPSPKQLRKPTKTDMPLPKFDTAPWSHHHRVIQCEMHVFVNMKLWMRMDVFDWSLEYERRDRPVTGHILLCRITDI